MRPFWGTMLVAGAAAYAAAILTAVVMSGCTGTAQLGVQPHDMGTVKAERDAAALQGKVAEAGRDFNLKLEGGNVALLTLGGAFLAVLAGAFALAYVATRLAERLVAALLAMIGGKGNG